MNKIDIVKDMERKVEASVITRKQLAEYLNLKDAKSVDVYLHGLPSINQRYFIADVAERLIDNMKWKGVRTL